MSNYVTGSYRRARKRLLKNVAATARCFYCTSPLTPETLTVDHKIPSSRGGKHHDDNLVVACRKCNKEKGVLTDNEFAPISNRKAADTHARGWEQLKHTYVSKPESS